MDDTDTAEKHAPIIMAATAEAAQRCASPSRPQEDSALPLTSLRRRTYTQAPSYAPLGSDMCFSLISTLWLFSRHWLRLTVWCLAGNVLACRKESMSQRNALVFSEAQALDLEAKVCSPLPALGHFEPLLPISTTNPPTLRSGDGQDGR